VACRRVSAIAAVVAVKVECRMAFEVVAEAAVGSVKGVVKVECRMAFEVAVAVALVVC
jgi:hypothetical protein